MLPKEIYQNRTQSGTQFEPWDTELVHKAVLAAEDSQSLRTTERALLAEALIPESLLSSQLKDEHGRPAKQVVITNLEESYRKKRWLILVLQIHYHPEAGDVLFVNDARGGRRWLYNIDLEGAETLLAAIDALSQFKNVLIWPEGELRAKLHRQVQAADTPFIKLPSGKTALLGSFAFPEPKTQLPPKNMTVTHQANTAMTHLDRLEAESIHIMREVVAQAENPVMLYSVGKDSAVMLHLAKKAFYPSVPPFPLMHVDTRWKFQSMYEFRDLMVQESGMELITHTNPEGVAKDVNPFDHGSSLHTDIMKTQGLKQALDKYGFDIAFGGARRDEEKSRAKERVFSFRTSTHRWDPKKQRPELWNIYNGYKASDESIRVFPLSNWTELDIWQYIYRENIPIVPLYYAAPRPVIERDGMLMLVDDDRIRLFDDDEVQVKNVRFRTLGCYPLTGAIESEATDLASIVLELLQSRTSERQGRAIDSDSSGSMEKKKQEGYF